ncbi:hypothetical protein Vadar_020105 [Vaccinium darrowii]|uniref:Uncharacterized protein n=1 Tax=Vaccinium darrowii TaxID=229202 RepID=A0ACB7Y224_9ERIC|nr:hypothetical protein Vadar_020105 [Vaccinium darrowii]
MLEKSKEERDKEEGVTGDGFAGPRGAWKSSTTVAAGGNGRAVMATGEIEEERSKVVIKNLIAEASRKGFFGQEELQWDSYKILSEQLEQE